MNFLRDELPVERFNDAYAGGSRDAEIEVRFGRAVEFIWDIERDGCNKRFAAARHMIPVNIGLQDFEVCQIVDHNEIGRIAFPQLPDVYVVVRYRIQAGHLKDLENAHAQCDCPCAELVDVSQREVIRVFIV